LTFKLLLERITAFANAAFTDYGHTDFAKPAKIGRVAIGFDPTNVLAMTTSEGWQFSDFTPWTE
jgi:hypothetical protein